MLLGHELVPQFVREERMEPGLGIANIVGLVALFQTLLIAVMSFD
jgi:hypothetical protein